MRMPRNIEAHKPAMLLRMECNKRVSSGKLERLKDKLSSIAWRQE